MIPNDPFNYREPVSHVPSNAPATNGLGIAGFVVSIFGLLTCGCLSIVGIILSAIALRRPPRGLALAGLIIGIIGILLLVVIAVALVAFGGMVILPAMNDGYTVRADVQAYKAAHNGAMPQSWTDLPNLSSGMDDKWGHPYRFVPLADGKSVQLESNGPDGIAGTADDLTVLIENDFVSAFMGHRSSRRILPRPVPPPASPPP